MKNRSSHKLSVHIMIAILSGLVVGVIIHQFPNATFINDYFINGLLDWGGRVFINALKMLVVPVVFISLVCGTFSMNNSGRFGFIALKTILLYLLTTLIAITIALLVTQVLQIGSPEVPIGSLKANMNDVPSIKQIFINIIPSNPIQAMANGNMLQIIVFALLLGIAINVSKEKGQKVREIFKEADHIIINLVHMIFNIAPYGVFCLITVLFAQKGLFFLGQLAGYFLAVILVLAIQLLVVYPSLLKLLTGLSPIIFLKKMWTAMLFAFSTSSSNASIPIVMETTEKKLGVDESVSAFVIPLGATVNMDGTTIMQGVATVFIANSYHVSLGITGYLTVILLATLASIGTAGVPSVGLITLTMVLNQVGLPVEGIAMIIGIDRILDMLRTSVNICGDAAIACIIGKSEGAIDTERFNNKDISDEIFD